MIQFKEANIFPQWQDIVWRPTWAKSNDGATSDSEPHPSWRKTHEKTLHLPSLKLFNEHKKEQCFQNVIQWPVESHFKDTPRLFNLSTHCMHMRGKTTAVSGHAWLLTSCYASYRVSVRRSPHVPISNTHWMWIRAALTLTVLPPRQHTLWVSWRLHGNLYLHLSTAEERGPPFSSSCGVWDARTNSERPGDGERPAGVRERELRERGCLF